MIDPSAYSTADFWPSAEREYLSGITASTLCQKYNVSMSSFRKHARAGNWRRMDRPDCCVTPEPEEYHLDDDVSPADLAHQAYLNLRRAVGTGRAAEAGTWMRLYDKLADRARAQVLSDLPDASEPLQPGEPRFYEAEEPTLMITNHDADIVEAPQELHPVHPVFSECNSAETLTAPEPETQADASDRPDASEPRHPAPARAPEAKEPTPQITIPDADVVPTLLDLHPVHPVFPECPSMEIVARPEPQAHLYTGGVHATDLAFSDYARLLGRPFISPFARTVTGDPLVLPDVNPRLGRHDGLLRTGDRAFRT